MNKPYSTACDRNRDPILQVLKKLIQPHHQRLLEIGSGTGQHAVYFAPHFPHLKWVPSDRKKYRAGIQLWMKEFPSPNIDQPLVYEVGQDDFPRGKFQIVYTANTFHIMAWKQVKTLIRKAGTRLRENCLFVVYGPFNYEGKFTSESNAAFDEHLKSINSEMGIRHFEDVLNNFHKAGFELDHDFEMPANNRTLVFRKKSDSKD